MAVKQDKLLQLLVQKIVLVVANHPRVLVTVPNSAPTKDQPKDPRMVPKSGEAMAIH